MQNALFCLFLEYIICIYRDYVKNISAYEVLNLMLIAHYLISLCSENRHKATDKRSVERTKETCRLQKQ